MFVVLVAAYDFPAGCLVLFHNSAPFLSPAVPADEMAYFGRSRICGTEGLPFSNPGAFSK